MKQHACLMVCLLGAALCFAEGQITRTFRNNKLWRDEGVPFMEKKGCRMTYRRLDDSEFDIHMRGKLLEEAHEVVEAKTKEELVLELADLQETIKAVAEWNGISAQEINEAQAKKFQERGGYTQRMFVEYAECPVGSYGERYYLADPLKYPEIIK